MRRWVVVLAMAAGAWIGSARAVEAQTRADTAAVLLNVAERLRAEGDGDAARALLNLIARDYAGTPAAGQVAAMLAMVRGMPAAQQSGRTELMVWSATYGAWVGVALPLMADSESPEAYGLGLLVGAPVGFFAAREYGLKYSPTVGQARAITFGGTWGTFQGFGWGEVLDIGNEKSSFTSCPPPEFNEPCIDYESESDPDPQALVATALLGGLAGIATGAVLARKPITAGTATAVTHGGLWGTWFGFGLSYIGGARDDDMLSGMLVGGNIALIATGLMAPEWRLSESRARLISIAGVIGGIAGAGLDLIAQPDDEEIAVAIPVIASAVGLALGVHHTRNHDIGAEDDNGSQGALLNLDRGRWALSLPEPMLQLRRDPTARRAGPYPDAGVVSGRRRSDPESSLRRVGMYVPLVKARF